jgi:hypothetical protein
VLEGECLPVGGGESFDPEHLAADCENRRVSSSSQGSEKLGPRGKV